MKTMTMKMMMIVETEVRREDETEGTLTADILRPAFLRAYEKVVEDGAGVCSRCEWQYGCLSCDPFKALRYWVRQELKRPEEDVRPRAKGRPKSAC